ncbi:L,D-transpeptidase family protein [Embleya sp. NBC_00896]|uniref:L,D-transpeptidase family protein n=1 Tax=Embleya sp. NBC_00896 TaxID=2975961 RepID=UPI00386E872C|nr:hypothetical protein OG928_02305 [Embleya sp. NBC_00896]
MTISRRSLLLSAPAALGLVGLASMRPASGYEPLPMVAPGPMVPGPAPVPVPPGIGPRWAAEIPVETTQLLLVVGEHQDSDRCTGALWSRTARGWRPQGVWPAHNGLRGWTTGHREDDLRSPVGLYTLTDAGGLLPNPGTRLPYDHSDGFEIDGTGFGGEPLAGTFDHVVAIDYNRVPGTSPQDPGRPRGDEFGGGIWLHIDHGGATHGCVTLPREGIVALLCALDPTARPVVVMGDAMALALGGPAS